jgi:hypothetical protein
MIMKKTRSVIMSVLKAPIAVTMKRKIASEWVFQVCGMFACGAAHALQNKTGRKSICKKYLLMKVTVVVSHYEEDLSWTRRVDKSVFEVYVVSKTLSEVKGSTMDEDCKLLHSGVNRGFEASAYLEYIVREYDSLPEYLVFVHGHEYSWHHEGSIISVLDGLDVCRLRDEGVVYANINRACVKDFVVDGVICEGPFRGEFSTWQRLRPLLFGCDVFLEEYEFPECPCNFRCRICAQFFVHRSQIQSRPKEVWCNLLKRIYELAGVTFGDKAVACTMEFLWCALLTGEFDESDGPVRRQDHFSRGEDDIRGDMDESRITIE